MLYVSLQATEEACGLDNTQALTTIVWTVGTLGQAHEDAIRPALAPTTANAGLSTSRRGPSRTLTLDRPHQREKTPSGATVLHVYRADSI